MLRVYACVTELHDPRLVLLAAVICLLACYTAMSLVARARETSGRTWLAWLSAAAAVTGCGVWATHFVAMLAFRPNLPIGYDLGLTALSIAIAISITWVGLFVALRGAGWTAIGGALAGAAVGAMHYAGMAAVRVPGTVGYEPGFVLASLAIGVILAAAALQVAARRPSLGHRAAAASLFAAGICGLHFTAMAATVIMPDPFVPLPDQVVAPEWLAVAVAAVTVLIVALGLVGSMVDQHLGARAAREAERLRDHVAELEAMKRELEETAASLSASLEAAAAGSQAKSQFLATMSHELRTPLNAVIGFSELLASETFGPLGDARYAEYARNIRDSGAHLLGLINDVLDLSKLDAGHLELYEEELDLREVVEEALDMLRLQAANAGVVLAQHLESGLPCLLADARRVRQVLMNLLSNAIKFTPAGGTVTASVFCSGAPLAITIADTGIGIAKEDIPKALERFGQIDSTLSRKYEGTGLGLPLSKRLMELHGGTLEIESAVGLGTTVTAAFPIARVVADDRRAA